MLPSWPERRTRDAGLGRGLPAVRGDSAAPACGVRPGPHVSASRPDPPIGRHRQAAVQRVEPPRPRICRCHQATSCPGRCLAACRSSACPRSCLNADAATMSHHEHEACKLPTLACRSVFGLLRAPPTEGRALRPGSTRGSSRNAPARLPRPRSLPVSAGVSARRGRAGARRAARAPAQLRANTARTFVLRSSGPAHAGRSAAPCHDGSATLAGRGVGGPSGTRTGLEHQGGHATPPCELRTSPVLDGHGQAVGVRREERGDSCAGRRRLATPLPRRRRSSVRACPDAG
jgi:hypothetical protein